VASIGKDFVAAASKTIKEKTSNNKDGRGRNTADRSAGGKLLTMLVHHRQKSFACWFGLGKLAVTKETMSREGPSTVSSKNWTDDFPLGVFRRKVRNSW
jgi:hypothetical protein